MNACVVPGSGTIPQAMKIPGLSQKRGWWYYQSPQVDGIRPARVALRTQDKATAVRAALQIHNHAPAAECHRLPFGQQWAWVALHERLYGADFPDRQVLFLPVVDLFPHGQSCDSK